MSLDWVSSIVQIVLVNAVLSGDNAMVIALAATICPRPSGGRPCSGEVAWRS